MVHPQVSLDTLKFLGLRTLQRRCLSPNDKLNLLTRHCLSWVTFHEAHTRISQTSIYPETTGFKSMLCALSTYIYCEVHFKPRKPFRTALWKGRNNHRLSFTDRELKVRNTIVETPTPTPEQGQKPHNTWLPWQVFLKRTGKRRSNRRGQRLFRGKRFKLVLITSAVLAKLYGCSFKNVSAHSWLLSCSPAVSQRSLVPHRHAEHETGLNIWHFCAQSQLSLALTPPASHTKPRTSSRCVRETMMDRQELPAFQACLCQPGTAIRMFVPFCFFELQNPQNRGCFQVDKHAVPTQCLSNVRICRETTDLGWSFCLGWKYNYPPTAWEVVSATQRGHCKVAELQVFL